MWRKGPMSSTHIGAQVGWPVSPEPETVKRAHARGVSGSAPRTPMPEAPLLMRGGAGADSAADIAAAWPKTELAWGRPPPAAPAPHDADMDDAGVDEAEGV